MRGNFMGTTVIKCGGLVAVSAMDLFGGAPPVGDKTVIDEMLREDFNFGGEQSGHPQREITGCLVPKNLRRDSEADWDVTSQVLPEAPPARRPATPRRPAFRRPGKRLRLQFFAADRLTADLI
jgi:hypothetical protein